MLHYVVDMENAFITTSHRLWAVSYEKGRNTFDDKKNMGNILDDCSTDGHSSRL